MSEDRAILESVFAKNRTAITDLDNLSHGHTHSSSTSSDHFPEISPGAHGRNLSFAAGVDTISVPDVLPPLDVPIKDQANSGDTLARRFSKRVGLGIHKSIMQTKATETEATLRNRWIKADTTKPMPSIAETSIASPATSEANGADFKVANNTSDSASSRSRTNSIALMGSSIGKSLSRAIRGLSLSNRTNIDHKTFQDGKLTGVPTEPGEQHTSNGHEQPGPVTALKLRLSKPTLKTPDYNEDFDNGV